MLTIPVQTKVTEPRTVAVTTPALHPPSAPPPQSGGYGETQCGASVMPCPYCGAHEQPEDRDGILSCPNCGYPLTQEIPLIDEWEVLINDASDPTPGVSPALCAGHDLDETGWAHLLTEIDALGSEDKNLC